MHHHRREENRALRQEHRAERQEHRLHNKAVNAAIHGNFQKAAKLEARAAGAHHRAEAAGHRADVAHHKAHHHVPPPVVHHHHHPSPPPHHHSPPPHHSPHVTVVHHHPPSGYPTGQAPPPSYPPAHPPAYQPPSAPGYPSATAPGYPSPTPGYPPSDMDLCEVQVRTDIRLREKLVDGKWVPLSAEKEELEIVDVWSAPEAVPFIDSPISSSPSDEEEELPQLSRNPCLYPGCDLGTVKNMRVHMMSKHAPVCFKTKSRPTTRRALIQLKVLEGIAKEMVGETATPFDVVSRLNREKATGEQGVVWSIDVRTLSAMHKLREVIGGIPTGGFSVNPISHPAALIHWRCFVAIAHRIDRRILNRIVDRAELAVPVLSQDQKKRRHPGTSLSVEPPKSKKKKRRKRKSAQQLQQTATQSYPRQEPTNLGAVQNHPAMLEAPLQLKNGQQSVQQLKPTAAQLPPRQEPTNLGALLRVATNAYDSHFNLNRLRQDLRLSLGECLNDMREAENFQLESRRVRVVGGIAIFSDPPNYSIYNEVCRLREDGYEIGVGINPAQDVSHLQFSRLIELTEFPQFKVLGPIGLDHSMPPSDWPQQDHLLMRVLSQCYSPQLHRVLCLHIRGMHDDVTAEECYLRALYILRLARIPADQRLLLHCFTSTIEVVDEYQKYFPGTYFGFSMSVVGFNRKQKEACKHIGALNDRRLLIESDGPHYRSTGERIERPNMLWLAAEAVGKVLDREAQQILDLTRKNGLDLF
ncbi:uncharacterized protein LOC117116965 [Anneissia japonica]|uniref:uncharacterized protein LOC117116965 n=1 Tax=Anneissia japonica TaxID=1529436 RepID=UPI001425A83A|nr:uncharacterized protein LOC117116965 [Anneissia japonica]